MIISSNLVIFQVCSWKSLKNVVKNEGNTISDHTAKTLHQCKRLCGLNGKCKSFSYIDSNDGTCTRSMACKFGNCHLKDKDVNPADPQKVTRGYKTYYKDCKGNW